MRARWQHTVNRVSRSIDFKLMVINHLSVLHRSVVSVLRMCASSSGATDTIRGHPRVRSVGMGLCVCVCVSRLRANRANSWSDLFTDQIICSYER